MRTIPTLAVLMAATLFTAAAARAQSARAAQPYPPGPTAEAKAWPPGPSGGATAYPPGPSGQAAAQTTNVNVVNTPTVNIGNALTVKSAAQEPFFYQRELDIAAGFDGANDLPYTPPAGKRLVLENVTVSCSSVSGQAVAVAVNGLPGGGGAAILKFAPPVTWWGAGSLSAQTYPVRVLVDGTLSLSAYRASQVGWTSCIVTLIGYLTPLA